VFSGVIIFTDFKKDVKTASGKRVCGLLYSQFFISFFATNKTEKACKNNIGKMKKSL
jgi:hypothetical protein